MPSTVPALDGLVPIWDFAVTAGVSEKELLKSLRADGVRLLEISVSGKRVTFADRNDLSEYIARNASTSAEEKKSGTLSQQLDTQARELARLKQQVEQLLSAKGAAA